jgi:hypothetical protein
MHPAPPVGNGGVLNAVATETLTAPQLLELLEKIVQGKPCESPSKDVTRNNIMRKDGGSDRKLHR